MPVIRLLEFMPFEVARVSFVALTLATFVSIGGSVSTDSGVSTDSSDYYYYWDAGSISASGSATILLEGTEADGGVYTAGFVIRNDVIQFREMIQQISSTANQRVSNVHIADEDGFNAFARSGRKGTSTVAVTSNMLLLVGDDKDALASLVGHEIAHLKLNHGAKEAAFRRELRMATSVCGIAQRKVGTLASACEIVLRVLGVPWIAHSLAEGVVLLAYSRMQEEEADKMAIRLAYEAGYDPYGGVRLEQKLGQFGDRRDTSFLDSHPSHKDRLASATKLAEELKTRWQSSSPTQVAEVQRGN